MSGRSEILERERICNSLLFEEIVINPIMSDLDSLDQIQGETTHRSSCAVPTSMLILSSLDLFGFLIAEHGNRNASERNISNAIKYNDYFPRAIYSDEIIKFLVINYRHGMMHSFFPIQTKTKLFGIHKSKNSELLERINVREDSIPIISLNVNVLSYNFRIFVDQFKNEIKNGNNPKLSENISKSFSKWNTHLTICSTTTKTTLPIGLLSNK